MLLFHKILNQLNLFPYTQKFIYTQSSTHRACSLASSWQCFLCCSSVSPLSSTCSLSPRSTSLNSVVSSGFDSTSLAMPWRENKIYHHSEHSRCLQYSRKFFVWRKIFAYTERQSQSIEKLGMGMGLETRLIQTRYLIAEFIYSHEQKQNFLTAPTNFGKLHLKLFLGVCCKLREVVIFSFVVSILWNGRQKSGCVLALPHPFSTMKCTYFLH